jgi:hypothetical protein
VAASGEGGAGFLDVLPAPALAFILASVRAWPPGLMHAALSPCLLARTPARA